jgi:UDP-glucose 4-epimerase
MIERMKKQPSAIVTGGAGFLGSHVAEELSRQGIQVVALDDLSGGFEDNVPAGVRFVRGSILDHRLIDSLFEEYRFDYVFHLAAYAAEILSHHIRRFNYSNNVVGSVNLINSAINYGCKSFVFTSSIAVYGNNPSPMTEEMIPLPEDPYGVAKFAVEMDLEAARRMYGLNYIIFRPHNVYGERQNIGDPYRNVIGIFMNQLLQNKPMTIFGDGMQSRAFSYVGDVAPLIARSVFESKMYGQIFNIGADKAYTVNELAKEVSRAMGLPHNVSYLEARHEVKIAHSSHDKLSKFTGYTPKFDLVEGITQMANWVKTTGTRGSILFQDIELMHKLPAAWRK